MNTEIVKRVSGVVHLFPLLIVLLVAVIAVFFFYQKSNLVDTPQPSGRFMDPQALTVEGGKVYKEGKVLFENANDVLEARIGPDGNTVHLKRKVKDEHMTNLCADLVAPVEIENCSPDVPHQAPWDAQKIGWCGTVKACGGGSGYLINSANFAYLVFDEKNKAELVVEDLSDGILKNMPMDHRLLEDFIAGTNDQKGNYWTKPTVVDKSNKYYLFPSHDSYVFENKLILTFPPLLVMVDLGKQQVVDHLVLNSKEFRIVDVDTFWFHGVENNPITVMEAGWEGPPWYSAIFDLSQDKLIVKNILDINNNGIYFSKDRKIDWTTKSVRITMPATEDLRDKVKDIVDSLGTDFENEAKITEAERLATERLKSSGLYKDVMCDFHPGMYAPVCEGLVDTEVYEYRAGGSFEKIESD